MSINRVTPFPTAGEGGDGSTPATPSALWRMRLQPDDLPREVATPTWISTWPRGGDGSTLGGMAPTWGDGSIPSTPSAQWRMQLG